MLPLRLDSARGLDLDLDLGWVAELGLAQGLRSGRLQAVQRAPRVAQGLRSGRLQAVEQAPRVARQAPPAAAALEDSAL